LQQELNWHSSIHTKWLNAQTRYVSSYNSPTLLVVGDHIFFLFNGNLETICLENKITNHIMYDLKHNGSCLLPSLTIKNAKWEITYGEGLMTFDLGSIESSITPM